MSHTPQALLFVFGEAGSAVTEQEFADWYDKEHAPARLTVPGISSASRYRAIDNVQPTWLALYDLSSPAVMDSEPYKGLRVTASDNERAVVSKLSTLNRRVYTLVSSLTLPTTTASDLPGKFAFAVSIQPRAEDEDEFNRWYEAEHMVLFSKVPGWLRGRRYKLAAYTELAGNAKPTTAAPFTYLAIHEFSTDRETSLATSEFKHATSTPWRRQVLGKVEGVELRWFERYKVFERPQE